MKEHEQESREPYWQNDLAIGEGSIHGERHAIQPSG